MIRVSRYLLLPLLLVQSGCAILTSYEKMEPQIDQWVDTKQYDRALDALGNVEAKDPQYLQAAEKRRKVEALAANYEQEIRRQTRSDLDKGKWAEALDTYDEALDRLPQSAVLKDGLAQLHREQSEELERLELKRLLDHGEWLKTTLPTYKAIARVDPRSRNAQQRLERKQQEAEDIAAELSLYGNKALANNHLKVAHQTLTLASDLSDAPAITDSLNKLHKRETQLEAKERAERAKRLQQHQAANEAKSRRIATILTAYKKAFKNKDYTKARKELDSLRRIDSKPEWDKLDEELKQVTDREAERLFDMGVYAYSRGHFEQAAKQWRKALEIKPDHKPSQENLERAERVLHKLQQLKEKQSDQ